MQRLHSARLAKSALLADTALPLEATDFYEPAAKPTGARILPTELWEMIFEHCHPMTLFILERVCRRFHEIINSYDGRLIVTSCDSPFEPKYNGRADPPPAIQMPEEGDMSDEAKGARLLLEIGKNGCISGEEWTRRYACYTGAAYMRLLFGGGWCLVCERWTMKPPHDLVTLTRMCSNQCTRRLHHENFLVRAPNAEADQTKLSKVGRHCPEDEALKEWMPFIKGRNDHLLRVKDLKRARQEYHELGKDEKKREQIYNMRRLMLCALLKLRNDYRNWIRYQKDNHRRFYNINMRWMRGWARKMGTKPARLFDNPAIKHTFDTYVDTQSFLTRQAMQYAHKKGHTVCETCDRFVPDNIWLAHVVGRHPEQAPMFRKHPETKEDERRCPKCPHSTRWYPLRDGSLERHMEAKHSETPMEGVEKTTVEKPKSKVAVPTAAAFVVDVYATKKVLGKRRAEEEPVVVQASTKRVKRALPQKKTKKSVPSVPGRLGFAIAGFKDEMAMAVD
ncbi:uncharacterized protein SCHCODRAFT_02521548 [Schizophyllum commune H4-8]|nr:uncharacterized protein SCHCODRAFT_02521548 [Schizophyllum commune H4-8]KAI5884913.1 hypothetical protein SCHCODRAFT_02521548 [Schizophyllum commune H4-8]